MSTSAAYAPPRRLKRQVQASLDFKLDGVEVALVQLKGKDVPLDRKSVV